MPLKKLIELNVNHRFEPSGFTGDKRIPNCTSIPDYVVRWLQLRFSGASDTIIRTNRTSIVVPEEDPGKQQSGNYCPDCSSALYRRENCWVCLKPGCGFSKC